MLGNLRCPCGKCHKLISDSLLWVLKSLERDMRIFYKKGYKLTLNSTVRCHEHNREVGGSPTSEHLKSNAGDLAYKNSNELYWLISIMLKTLNIKRILIYSSFVHMGISKKHPQKVIKRMG